MIKKLRVAHFPQVPCKPFHVEVKSLEEAKLISDTLANYDLFQYDNRIKGDYANATVVEEYCEEEGEWISWSDDDTGIDDIDAYFEHLEENKGQKKFTAFKTTVKMETEDGSKIGLVVQVNLLSSTLYVRDKDNKVYEVSMNRVEIV